MTMRRSLVSVVLALAISLSITGAFVLGSPAPTPEISSDLTHDGRQVPAPTSDEIVQNGTPPPRSAPFPTFEEVTSRVGFEYEPNVPSGIEDVNSGVYVVDFDDDGYEDVLAVGERYPVLFENVGGEFVAYRTFELPRVQTAHFFDADNDGDRDLLMAQYAGSLVFYENVHGSFRRENVGFDRGMVNPTSIVSADFSGDGCLDVFVTQNGLWSGTTPLTLAEARRVQEHHPDVRPTTQSGKPNVLYYGDCESFTDVTQQAGLEGHHWSLASSAADLTGDGYPDIHVGNDWSSDYIYVNEGNGTFDRRRMGPNSDRNAMSSTVDDMNGDLVPDLFVTNIYYPDNHTRTDRAPPLHRDAALPEGNNYFVNDGTGNFTDEAPEHGLQKGGWGWTATVADFNNDGHLDVVQSTTDIYWVEPYRSTYSSLQVWRGTQETWEKVDSREYGLDQENTYAVARIDYDNDGHLDVIVGTAPLGPTLRGQAQPFKVYENTREGDDYLQFFVRDPSTVDRNAAVYVQTDRRVIYASPNSRGNFQSQDSRLIHVGTRTEEVERVVVLWPDGSRSVYTTLESGNRYVLRKDGAEEVR